MIKIKIFRSNDMEKIEKYTNEFIQDKNVVDINIQPTFAPVSFDCKGIMTKAEIIDTVMVFYEEKV